MIRYGLEPKLDHSLTQTVEHALMPIIEQGSTSKIKICSAQNLDIEDNQDNFPDRRYTDLMHDKDLRKRQIEGHVSHGSPHLKALQELITKVDHQNEGMSSFGQVQGNNSRNKTVVSLPLTPPKLSLIIPAPLTSRSTSHTNIEHRALKPKMISPNTLPQSQSISSSSSLPLQSSSSNSLLHSQLDSPKPPLQTKSNSLDSDIETHQKQAAEVYPLSGIQAALEQLKGVYCSDSNKPETVQNAEWSVQDHNKQVPNADWSCQGSDGLSSGFMKLNSFTCMRSSYTNQLNLRTAMEPQWSPDEIKTAIPYDLQRLLIEGHVSDGSLKQSAELQTLVTKLDNLKSYHDANRSKFGNVYPICELQPTDERP